MTHDLCKLWLKIAAVVIGSFAPVFFLGSMEPTAEPARFTTLHQRVLVGPW